MNPFGPDNAEVANPGPVLIGRYGFEAGTAYGGEAVGSEVESFARDEKWHAARRNVLYPPKTWGAAGYLSRSGGARRQDPPEFDGIDRLHEVEVEPGLARPLPVRVLTPTRQRDQPGRAKLLPGPEVGGD